MHKGLAFSLRNLSTDVNYAKVNVALLIVCHFMEHLLKQEWNNSMWCKSTIRSYILWHSGVIWLAGKLQHTC